ncbi:MAG: phosphate ABC transporter permease PstA [Candidatus Cloacimonadaceae bacterium]|jgi:phosphate transport system permease protein|nr:phosphate ABC transporter permease PstA [Candidatus Cloacimonadaceae bacterium]
MISQRKLKESIGIGLIGFMMMLTIGFLLIFVYRIFGQGIHVISWEFISTPPREAMTAGGILPALIGTFWLTFLAVLISVPVGIFTAIYLNNYARPRWFVSTLKITINTLAGVPSIIFGLFGMALFVNMLNLQVSLISGVLTLAVLSLPMIINASEEALASVPRDNSEASYALGASKRQTIQRILIPAALPNILTSIILVVGRVAGETAPIMYTAVTFFNRQLPKSIHDEVMALPYHIFALMTEGTKPAKQVPIAYGSALVLMTLVLLISSTALALRYYLRKKRQW